MKRNSYFFTILYVLIVISLYSTNSSYAAPPSTFINLDPSSGEVGITITVTGGNFKKNDIATITYDGATVATISTGKGSTGGAFSTTFTIPASVAGAHTVRATDTHGSTASATFTVTPTASMNPTTGAVGSSVTITGKGVTGSVSVNVKYDGTTVATTSSDSTGSFSTSFTVPHSIAGIHTVSVTDGTNSGSGPFTVVPSAILNSTSGSVGNTVRVSGLGYAASSTVTIKYDGTILATTPATVTTNSTGGFTSTITIPSSTSGSHTIKATDASGNTDSHTFTVTAPTQSISLNPLTGAVASTVTVSGNSFTTSSTITIKYDSTTLATTPNTVTTNSTGGFTATITIPSSTAGSHTIQATDASSKSASQTYTVEPSASISPRLGKIGNTVTVSGSGYSASSTVTIKYSGTAISTASTDSSGSFSGTFKVPSSTNGIHTIQSTDGTNSNSMNYTTIASISSNTRSGAVGSSVTITGHGYTGSSTITIKYNGTTVTTNPSTVTSNSTGSFSASFTIPASETGTYIITATDASSKLGAEIFAVVPTATMSPTTGAVGSSVLVTGKGTVGSTTITIKYDGTIVATPSSDSTGSFSTSFNVPSSVAGEHTVSVTDGTNSGSGLFTVTSAITLNSTSGNVASTVKITGNGYAATSNITIKYDSTTLATTPSTVTTNSTGGFTATITIPSSTAGSHTIKATDASGNTHSQTFTVATPPTQSISLNPVTGAVASTVTVSGNSFTTSSTITIKYDSTTLATTPSTVTTNSTGGFTATITIPSSTAGSHTIQATDASSKSASQIFTIAPFATMSPVAGQSGTSVSGSGHGYASSSTVTVYFDGSSVTTASTNSTGSFSASFNVPNLTDGQYTVKASDGQNSNSGTFTITLDPLTPNNPSTNGAIGGNSARGTFSSSAYSAQEFLGYSSLSSSARNSILNQDPNIPLSPSNDPSIPFYPLQIGDNKYLIARYSNTIQTVTENVGTPIDMQLRSADRSVSHVELYMNFQGTNKEIQDSDTFIIYDKDLPLQIKDPHGYFSNVRVNIMADDKTSKIDTSITFAKSMKKSNIIIREWNAEKYASTTKINDALEVQPNPNITTFKDDIPKSTIVENTPIEIPKTTTNTDITSYIKQWGGYSPVSISDSELLAHLGINANHIPSWFMKTVKWIDSGDSTSDDFSNAIKFMYQNKIIK